MKSLYPDGHIPDNVSLSEFVLNRFAAFGNRTALPAGKLDYVIAAASDENFARFRENAHQIEAETGRSITYREYGRLVTSLGAALTQEGVGRGDVVMTMTPNCIEHPIVLLAVVSAGAILAPCSSMFTLDEVIERIHNADVKYIFTTQHLLPLITEAMKAQNHVKKVFTFDGSDDVSGGATASFWSLVKAGERLLLSGVRDAGHIRLKVKDTVAVLPYSSGTTGRPKGVMLTHHNFVANLVQASYYDILFCRNTGCVVLTFLPFYHIYGICNLQLLCSYLGNTMVVMRKYDLQTALHCIQQYKVSFLPLVPPVAMQLLKSPLVSKYDLTSLQTVFSGAAPFGLAASMALKQKLNVEFCQGYGLTETCPITHMPPRVGYKDGSIGVLVPNLEAKIMDPESLRELGAGETGELWMRGPNITKGYWKAPQATAQTLVDGGWLRSGDIGYYDNDGAFYIVDRLKELIKYKGHQVAPAVLEDLLQSFHSIEDAAVIGIADEAAGELPRAYVVIKTGHQLNADDVHTLVQEKLAPPYKLRGGVEFVKSIPKSPSGKILRRQLRAVAQAQRKPTSSKL